MLLVRPSAVRAFSRVGVARRRIRGHARASRVFLFFLQGGFLVSRTGKDGREDLTAGRPCGLLSGNEDL